MVVCGDLLTIRPKRGILLGSATLYSVPVIAEMKRCWTVVAQAGRPEWNVTGCEMDDTCGWVSSWVKAATHARNQ